jgi:hypothetical protein
MLSSTRTACVRASTRAVRRASGGRRVGRARVAVVRASGDDDADGEDVKVKGDFGTNPLTGEALEAKGQMTAIVTGIVSVGLAVAYLGLVQVMDSRDMAPPPPEAMGDGSAEFLASLSRDGNN